MFFDFLLIKLKIYVMKTLGKISRLFLGFFLFLVSFSAFSQGTNLTNEDLKESKKEREYYNFLVMDSILQSQSFVLEADYLENQYGYKRPVVSTLNFIKVDSSNVVLQTGSNRMLGSNGVGGATAEGNVKDLNIVKDLKNHTHWLRFSIVTNIGVYDVSMTVYANGLAKATITGLTPGKLIYDGRIETLYNSRVYRGRNSI